MSLRTARSEFTIWKRAVKGDVDRYVTVFVNSDLNEALDGSLIYRNEHNCRRRILKRDTRRVMAKKQLKRAKRRAGKLELRLGW